MASSNTACRLLNNNILSHNRFSLWSYLDKCFRTVSINTRQQSNSTDGTSLSTNNLPDLPKIIQPNLKKAFAENKSEKAAKISKAMKAYLERARQHDEFMKHEIEQFEIGRRHLANIMGKDADSFNQEDINEAISYLLPSGLYDKAARPLMLHPEVIFPKRKDAEFGLSGRPHNTLFYTMRPNFYNLLHESDEKLEKLNKIEDRMVSKGQLDPPESDKLILAGSQWIDRKHLEKKLLEKLKDFQYQEFVSCLSNLANHPYSYREKDFIFTYRQNLADRSQMEEFPEPIMRDDSRLYVESQGRRKKAVANVKITDKGTGLLKINNSDISFFEKLQDREQLLFPLQFTGFLHQVDIEATVSDGGRSAQAGALRYAIARGLVSFVSPEERERMRLAGLLTRDIRRKERKKVGQKGARAKYTWKKR